MTDNETISLGTCEKCGAYHGSWEPCPVTPKSWLTANMADAVPEEPRPHFHCGRCGARELISLPFTAEHFDVASNAFVAIHRECKEPNG